MWVRYTRRSRSAILLCETHMLWLMACCIPIHLMLWLDPLILKLFIINRRRYLPLTQPIHIRLIRNSHLLLWLRNLTFNEILVDYQRLVNVWWLVFWVLFLSFRHHHFIPKHNLRCISALTTILWHDIFLECSWFSFELAGCLILKSIFNIQNRAIWIFLHLPIYIMSCESVSLMFWYIFLSHI